jgi:hypothetical protein
MPTKKLLMFQLDFYREPGSAQVRRERNAGYADVEVVVFDEGGPIDDPLDTAADGPSRWIRVCQSGTGKVHERVIIAYLGPPFGMDQHGRGNGEANPARHGGEPADLRVDSEQTGGISVAPLHPGAIEHTLDTEHPCFGLIATAGLAVSDHAAGRVRTKIGSGNARESTGDIVGVIRSSAAPYVGANVAAGPGKQRRWRRGQAPLRWDHLPPRSESRVPPYLSQSAFYFYGLSLATLSGCQNPAVFARPRSRERRPCWP